MEIKTDGLSSPYTAGGTIAKRRIVKFGSADGVVVQASAATDLLIGVSSDLGSVAGERQDVFETGNVMEVDFGGTIARGASVTSDANGKAVAAASGNIAIGYATKSGVSGDVGSISIIRHTAA